MLRFQIPSPRTMARVASLVVAMAGVTRADDAAIHAKVEPHQMNQLMTSIGLATVTIGLNAGGAPRDDCQRTLLTPPSGADRPTPRLTQRVPVTPGQSQEPGSYLFPAPRVPGGEHNVAADFNLDGFMDIAAAHRVVSGMSTVTLHYGTPDGTFQDGEVFPFGTNHYEAPTCLAVGRFNNDDLPDLVVQRAIQTQPTEVTMFLAQPSGGFALGDTYPIGGNSIVAGDFNADGFSDIINGYGTIRYGQGDGTLGPSSGVSCVSGSPTYPAVADFNGDDVDDIALGFGNNFACVLYGQPGLGLGAPEEYGVGGDPGYLAAGDFNGDGLDDLAAVIYDASNSNRGDWLLIYYAQPEGGLGVPQNYSGWTEWSNWGLWSSAGARGMVATDLDGDGRDDLAVGYYWNWLSGSTWYYQSALMVLYGPQRGEWHPWRTRFSAGGGGWLGTPLSQRNHAAADMDGDRRGEILTTGGVIIDFNKTDGRLATRSDYIRIGDRLRGITAADIDADGALDLATTDEDAQVLRILWGDGSGGFTVDETTYPTESPAIQVAAADLDNDNDLDLAVSTTANRVRVFYQTSPRVFGSFADHDVAGGTGVAPADFNHDNRMDLAVGGVVLYGQANGTLGHPTQIDVGGDIVAADFDWDGWVDIAGRYGTGNRWLGAVFNQAGTAFTAPVGVELASSPRAITVGDFNHDNWLDLAAWEGPATGGADRMIDVLYGGFGGVFPGPVEQHGPYSTNGVESLASADFNRDGPHDLFASMPMAVFLGQESGPLAAPRHHRGSGTAYDSAIADFDRDGRLDVATVGGGTVSIFFNQDTHKAVGDLEMVSMVGPVSGLAGQLVDVSWTVRNKLTTPLTAQWTDGVYLSLDQTWDIYDRCVGTLEYTGTLGGEDEYTRDATVSLPTVVEGDYHLLVRTDMYDDIREDGGEGDNQTSSPVTIDVARLAIGQLYFDEFAFEGQGKLYLLTVDAEEDLLFTLNAIYATGANELYARHEHAATRASFDAKYEHKFSPDQIVRVPGTNAGDYYVLAYADRLPPDEPAGFTLKAESLPLEVTHITPDRGGNTGRVTVTFEGSGFHSDVQVVLLPYGGNEIHSLHVFFYDAGSFVAVFDLDGQTIAPCGLRLNNPGADELTLEGGFVIEEGDQYEIYARFSFATRTIRPGRPAGYVLDVWNSANIDVPFVFLNLSAPDTQAAGIYFYPDNQLSELPYLEGFSASEISPTTVYDRQIDYPIIITDFPAGSRAVPYAVQLQFRVTPTQTATTINIRASYAPVSGNEYETFVFLSVEAVAQRVAELLERMDGDAAGLPEIREGDPDLKWLNSYLSNEAGKEQLRENWSHFMDDARGIGKWSATKALGLGLKALCPECAAVHELVSHVESVVFIIWRAVVEENLRTVEEQTGVVRSSDPNDKLSPGGWSEAGFVQHDSPLKYTIRFENLPAAGAAALKVEVTDQLHEILDWTTLTLEEIGFEGTVIEVPEGLSHYEGRVEIDGWTWNETDGWHRYEDEAPLIPLVVDVEAGIDIDTGVVHWLIECADVNTGNYPEDPYAGFLPPNQEDIYYPDPDDPDDTPRMIHPGEGYLKYSVRPLADLPSGTEITNMALIVFDWNAPINTPEVLNTIDAEVPFSEVDPLPAEMPHAEFEMCWSGEDEPNGSGIAAYTILVSDNGVPYAEWLTTEDVCAVFTGTQFGHSYSFYSVARDHVGHAENAPTDSQTGAIIPDATTTVTAGDLDDDGDLDLFDYAVFQTCLTGDGGSPVAPECEPADFDFDNDVDLIDFASFQVAFGASD